MRNLPRDYPREPETLEVAIDAMRKELVIYRSIGPVEEFRALKEAEQKRREGCDKCREAQHLFWYKQSDYTRCPHCGRDLRGESHDGD